MARIVVGTDGSGPSRVALRWAATEARLREASLEVVHTWSPDYTPWSSPIYSAFAGVTWAEDVAVPAEENVRRDVTVALEKLLDEEDLSATGHPPTTAMALEGPSGPTLVQAATGADLLVVGARGLGEVKGLFLGSVSLYCVTHAPVSVTVVRGPA
jgi:nucleotide-binding universal stress UspA family protein